MADAHFPQRPLANGQTRIDFQTEPSRYRHWKLKIDGDIATLLLDVDEKGALFDGYELKLNSYDLGVDLRHQRHGGGRRIRARACRRSHHAG